MSKLTALMLCALVFLAGSGLATDSEDACLETYQLAVSNYYDVTLESVLDASDAGLPTEELPVLFFIANQANTTTTAILTARLDGQHWASIAAEHDLVATDFYVHTDKEVSGARFNKIFYKFKDLTRQEFAGVELEDSDIIDLTNLRFLYHHYNYSQHIIMSQASQGKSFLELNQGIYASTVQMKEHYSSNTDR